MPANFEYYRIFYQVALHGNLTQAAAALHSSQPNVTRAMNNLEAQLHCRLFVRSNRGVTLTPEGQQLFEHVKIACEQLIAGEDALRGDLSLQSGRIRLGVTDAALNLLMLPVLRRFHSRWPGVRIQIFSRSTTQNVQALQNGEVHLAVVTTPTGAGRELTSRRLRRFEEYLVAGPQFFHLAGKTLHLQELSQYPLIVLGRETQTYWLYRQHFSQYGLLLSPDLEASNVDQVLPMVKNDLGLGFLPESFAHEALRAGEIVRVHLAEPLPPRAVCLLKTRAQPLSLAEQALERLLIEEAAGEDPQKTPK